MAGLTKRQADLLDFIQGYAGSNGPVSPSYNEMAAGIGLRGKSGIHRLVHGLVERGHLTIIGKGPRSVALVRGRPVPHAANDSSSNMRRCDLILGLLRKAYATAHADEACEIQTDGALHQIAVAAVAWGDNAQVARRLRSMATTLNLAATALGRPVAVEG